MTSTKFPYISYIAGIVLVSILWLVSVTNDIPIRHLISDPAQINKTPYYIGFLSNVMAIVWGIGALPSLFTASLLKSIDREWYRFFLLGGSFTLVLLLDDLFMFHEEIFPHYLFFSKQTGIEPNEKFAIAGYGLFAIWFLYTSRHTIRKTTWSHLAVAAVILTLAILADRGVSKKIISDSATRAFIEDSLKFLGALGWSLYFLSTARTVVANQLVGTGGIPATGDGNQGATEQQKI